MRTKQRSSQCRAPRASLLLTLTTIILFSCSQESLAQQWSNNGNDIHNSNSGNVGVGTNSPGVKLDILSSVSLIARFGSTAGAHSQVLIDAPAAFNSNLTLQRGGVSKWFMGNRASNDRLSFMESTGAVEVLTLLQNGNVGVGTSDPQDAFHFLSTPTNQVATMRLQAGNASAAFIGIWNPGQMLLLTNNRHPGTGNNFNSAASGAQLSLWGPDIVFHATSSGPVGNGTELMRIKGGGQVGIGTAAPNFKLDVNGEINATGFRINGTPISTGGAVSSVFGRTGAVVAATNDYTWAQVNKSTSSLADIATRSAGDLSSGTLPDARFPVILPAVSGANLTALNASNLANGTVPIARLGSGTADSTKFLRGDNTWAVPSGTSQWTTSGTSIFYNSGNVGVGTPGPPTEKLEVIGNIKVSGNINAKYQDVAEWVDSSQELVAGTVVVLDSSRSNHVIAATQSYDSRIAGVISRQPGLTLGEEAEGRVLVATTGRVSVKVDATEGPIQIGDLLVTSNREGFAMKSLPVDVGGVRMHRPGTLIGKALEPLAKGTGEILVLLSLQ